MILRCVSWCIFLCLALQTTVNAKVHVTEQGYENVFISFSPNVPSENGPILVKNVTELLEHTSRVLHKAIGIRIATATFLLPPSWSPETWEDISFTPATFEQAKTKPDIYVDATEQSPFGKHPVSLQHGGCGVPGHYITLPADFLGSEPTYPKDKLLAREWLKHRYGVFEENGFKYDELYPDYYKVPGSSEIRITECTDKEVPYIFKNPSDEEECNPLDLDFCRFHPENGSAENVTSSLMYFHQEIQSMTHICGKDDLPHHNTTRSKQNVLCDGRSIWDVVQLSEDFETTQNEISDEDFESIQFSFIQPSQPRFVVLLEDSDNLHNQQVSIKLALRQFYYDLPPKSKLAIYTFSSELKKVKEAFSYKELPQVGRDDLGSIGDFIVQPDNICASCGLDKAIETLVVNSEVRNGSIFLITASSLDKPPVIPDGLKDKGISLSVLRFAEEFSPVDDTFNVLEDKFSSFSYVQIANNLEQLPSFESVSTLLKNPVPEHNDFQTITVATGIMSSLENVTISQNAAASLFTLWVGSQYNDADSITCKAGETDVPLTDGVKGTEISTFTFSPVEGDVSCVLSSARLSRVLTQVRMTTHKGYYFDFDTWFQDKSSKTEQMPIIIYAKIYFGGHPVKDASVTATISVEKKSEEETQNSSNNVNEILVKLLDNGRGDPDVTQHDGVYSGYFTGFETAGKYEITVKINDNDGAAKAGKEYSELTSATCCGSKVISEDSEVPAFNMEKMIEYTTEKNIPEGGYAPSRILDFRVALFNSSNYALLTWTAPEGASSYEFYTFCNFEDCKDGRLPHWLKLNETGLQPKDYGETEEAVILLTPNISEIENNLSVFFAIKSASKNGKMSDLSNKAEIFLSLPEEPSTTTAPITNDGRKLASNDTAGIIIGSVIVGALLLLCIGTSLYLFVFKPRRAKPSGIDNSAYIPEKNLNGTEISGSFRAVPVRVRGSMRRVESFPVLLYTHDQLKDFKKKVDPPLYKPSIAPRPWMSMHVLSNNEPNKGGDSKSIGSDSTLPMHDKHRCAEMKQLDDISLASDTPLPEESIKF